MSVRAKFKCTFAKRYLSDDGSSDYIELRFDAVIDDSEDNKQWSKWTPFGSIHMNVTNPNCFDRFEEGEEYYLDFTPAN